MGDGKRKWSAAIGVATAIAALAGCSSTGMGSGDLEQAGKAVGPVTFNWVSTDGGISGNMEADLPGASFSGRFFQITPRARVDNLGPLWNGWNSGWGDWPYWSAPPEPGYATTQFITQYTGKVVANLVSPSGTRMRCRFHLLDPIGGMSGGGEGECQLRGGRLVRAIFPAG